MIGLVLRGEGAARENDMLRGEAEDKSLLRETKVP